MGRHSPTGKGAIALGRGSTLRKLMRAVRRGKIAAWWPRPQDEQKMLRRYKRKGAG